MRDRQELREDPPTASTPADGLDCITIADLIIDLRGREVRVAGRVAPLTRIEFDILAYLAAHPGWVVSPDQLMEEVWGYSSFGDTRSVSVHIGNLRRKLGDDPARSVYIQTVRGAGYKVVNPVARERAGSAEAAREPAEAVPPTVTAPNPAPPPLGADAHTTPTALPVRGTETARLTDAWHRACRGHGGLVLIAGDPGMGKTRLASELADRAVDNGGSVAWGRCHETAGLPAYWPWIQCLRGLAEMRLRGGAGDAEPAPPESIAMLLGPSLRASGETSRPGGAGATAPGPDDRERFFRDVVDFLATFSTHRPTLLLFDDLHLADPSSLLLLESLALESTLWPILVVGTYRPAVIRNGQDLARTVAALTRVGAAELHLAGLTPPEVGRLMRMTAGDEVAPELVQLVHERTGGNPLFVVELTRLLALDGRLAHPGVADRSLPGLPHALRGVLERHLTQLSPRCRNLLDLAALLGRSIDPLILSDASDLAGEALLPLLDEAIDARILERDAAAERYRFVHPLLQEALVADTGETGRLRLHARIGETLEAHSLTDPDWFLPDLAYHFSRAAPLGYGPRAFDYSRRAGQSAFSRYGYEEAAEHLARAISLLPCSGLPAASQRAEAARCHEQVGDALSLTAKRGDAVQAFGRAARLLPAEDIVGRARLERKTGGAWLADQEPAQARAAFDAAETTLGVAPSEPQPGWAHERIELSLQQMAALYFVGDLDGLGTHAENARRLVEAEGTAHQQGVFASHYLAMAFRRERYQVTPETLAFAREHQARMRGSIDGALAREGAFQLGFALLWTGALDDAEEHLTRCVQLADDARDHAPLVRASTYLTVLQRLRGNVDRVAPWAETSLRRAAEAHLPGYVAAAKANQAWVALQDDDRPRVDRLAGEALTLWNAPSAFPFEWLARGPLLRLAAERADLPTAAAHAEAMLGPTQQRLADAVSGPLTDMTAAWKSSADPQTASGALVEALAAALAAAPQGFA